jgi:hypothetical protein
MDQLSLSESLMCMGGGSSDFLSDYHSSRSLLCVNPCASSLRNDTLADVASTLHYGRSGQLDTTSLSDRNLENSETPWHKGVDGEPSWGL